MKTILLFIIIHSATSLFAQNLVKFKSNGKYGFKSAAGKVIVPPIYTWVNDFSEGLVAVYSGGKLDEVSGILVHGKWGFINHSGKVVIIPKYDDVGSFTEGLCSVVIFDNPNFRSGEWGFIDKTGKTVIPFKFGKVAYFKNGLAEIEENGREYVIDKAGKEVVIVKQLDTNLNIVDDVMPKYKNGGFLEQINFIKKNLQLKYVSQLDAARTGTKSRSLLELIINTEGKVKEAKILRGVNQEADNDLLRVVKLLEFIPEVRMGKKLEVKYTLIYTW